MVPASSDPVTQPCPACGEGVDVSGTMPMEKVACQACGSEMRARMLFDHYRIEEMRGIGGMSQVFVALDNHLGRLVALKVLNRENSAREERIRQFEREAKLTASINHPNVVRVYGVGRAQGNFYIAMELVDGSSLEEVLRNHEKVTEGQVLDLAIQTTEGLAAAHRIGLIHRDIKPGNILLTAEGKAKLVDFGLALVFETDVDESEEIWATPYYVSPEKLEGKTEDFRSDIYSLGATLFHLLAGRPMYDTDTASIDELREIKSKPVRLGAFAPMVSETTQQVVNRMITNNPGERHASYEELLDDLKAARSALRSSLGKIGRATREARREAGRKKKLTGLVVMSLALVAVVAGLAMWHGSNPSKEKDDPGENGGGSVEAWEVGTLTGGGVSERFLQARQAMKDGRYDEARREFMEIFNDQRTRQPTANWAAYSAALADLFAGEPGRARQTLRQMRQSERYGKGTSRDVRAFFDGMTDRMLRAWPVPAAELEEVRQAKGWQAAALLIGLKNWEHGRFANAAKWIEAVQQSDLPATIKWIEDLRPLLSRYTLDAGTLAAIHGGENFQKSADVGVALSEAQTALTQLRTGGRARRWLESRVAGLERQRDDLAAREAEEQAQAQAQRRAEEMRGLGRLREEIAPLRSGYQFATGVNKLEGNRPVTPEARAAWDVLQWYWQGGEAFLGTLVEDLNKHGFQGRLQPREGAVVYRNVRITKATRTNLVVEGDLGVFNPKVAEMAAAQLISLGKSMLEKAEGEEAALNRRGLLALFARHTGAAAEAARLATMMEADKEFTRNWEALSTLGETTAEDPSADGETANGESGS